ncbi:MAG: hypothetical protein R2856_30525 [Caldilineaceae bacterium]
MANAVIGQLVETPLFLERELGLLRGNVMHLEMSVNQMFMMRPSLDMGDYRGPLKSSTSPAPAPIPAAASWAAGRNTAAVVLKDLQKRNWLGG